MQESCHLKKARDLIATRREGQGTVVVIGGIIVFTVFIACFIYLMLGTSYLSP